MSERSDIRFLLNDREIRLGAVDPHAFLLDWLRIEQRLTGTKEGCAEGDCGACTVLIGRRDGATMRYEPANACIRFLASCDLTHVVTVEHLGRNGLHPVQDALVTHHGSQCGFCTPGIVMALAGQVTEGAMDARVALQGNLCRCTGYAPILRAMEEIEGPVPLPWDEAAIAARLTAMEGQGAALAQVYLPRSAAELDTALEAAPDATLVAGATDVGLWVAKELRDIGPVIHLTGLAGLDAIEVQGGKFSIGALASYADLRSAVARDIPALAAYIDRIGGPQIRAAGTIGGNIANGSPIGDMPPALIALGARLILRRPGGALREIALEDFFVDYGQQDIGPGELVWRVDVPLPGDDLVAFEKISKRRDEDITAVALSLRLRLEGADIAAARIACGGMAATPRRAKGAEAALIGQPWREATIRAAMAAIETDFAPISDHRASAAYRMTAAKNLLFRVFAEREGLA